jgi:hypothetical protein
MNEMINSAHEGGLTDRSMRAALLRLRFNVEARKMARLDIRGTVDIDFWTEEQKSLASTPYVEKLRASAERASRQVLQRLWDQHAALLLEIKVRADAVVQQHCLGHTDTVHHRRLVRSLGAWESAVGRAEEQVGAVVAGFNQLLNLYWSVLSRRHELLKSAGQPPPAGQPRLASRPRRAPRPALIVRDPRWSRPFELFPPWLTASPSPSTVLEKAIDIVVGVPA